MPAGSSQISSSDSALFQSQSDTVASNDLSGYFSTPSVISSGILHKTIEFEMLDHKPSSVISDMKNNCIMILYNECSEEEKIEKNERINDDIKEVPRLPEPRVVLFPPKCVQLGWQDEPIVVGSGLYNPGVICYINSTLQALFHIPAFTNWLVNDNDHRRICRQKTEFQKSCILCVVGSTFILSHVHSGHSFMASKILNCLPLICKHLSINRQEDAHEFLRYLIESMGQCYISALGNGAQFLDIYSRETTPINQIFGGYIRSEVSCVECGYISTTFQHFQDLSLDISRSDTINDALDSYFEKEPLDASYGCGSCKRQVVADKKCSIERAPNVLCLQLKRYSVSMDGLSSNKNSKPIKIQERLDLFKYQFVHYELNQYDARPLRYRLVSMVMHYGMSLYNGHYTALGLISSGTYYYFNDSSVYPVNFQNFSTSDDSYILFYELEPKENINLEC